MTASLDNVVIIGCGTVGANVAVELIKNKLTDRLTLVDYDIISAATSPFEEGEIGLHKATVTRGLCLIENPGAIVTVVIGKINKSSKLDGYFIIDCRDNKTKDIKTNVRISMDGPYLTIDSRKDYVEYDSSDYVMVRRPDLIPDMMDIIVRYFKGENYYLAKSYCHLVRHGGSDVYVE